MSISSTPTPPTSARRRDVRRLAGAHLISLTGSEAAFTALTFTIYQRTGSAGWAAAALFLACGTLGVLSPVAGSLGDHFDRRRVMIASDLARAVCFASLAFVHSPASLLGLAFLAAAAASPFYSAAQASVPNLVGPEDVAWANGTVSMGMNVGYTLGPMLGGVLVAAVGAPTVFLLNAISFVASAGLVRVVRGSFTGGREDAGAHRGMRAGFRFIARDAVLRRIMLAFVVFLLAVGSVLVANLPLARGFHVGAAGYGLLLTAWGVGALPGAWAARRLGERTERRALVGFSFLTALALASVSVLPVFTPIILALFVAGASDGIVDVAAMGIFQRRTPDAVRSRVLAVLDGALMVAFAVSFLFAGALVEAFGPRAAYAVAGAGCLVAAILLVPLLRGSPQEAMSHGVAAEPSVP